MHSDHGQAVIQTAEDQIFVHSVSRLLCYCTTSLK